MRQSLLPALLVMSVLLTACQTSTRDPSSRFFLPPTGTRVVVNEDIPIPKQWARVYLQDGTLYAKSRYNEYYPNCVFWVHDVSDGSAKIEADIFEVHDVSWGSEDVLGGGQPPMLAGLSIGTETHIDGIGMIARDGGATFQIYNVTMHLRSDRQPGVLKLQCNAGKADPDKVEQPTIEQMRQSLGSYATLELPAGTGS